MSVTALAMARIKAFAIVLVLAASIGAGAWAGHRWAEGEQAMTERDEKTAYLASLQDEITRLQTQSAESALAYAEATERLNTIANSLEKNREENRKFAEGQQAALAALLDRRPELRAARAGDDVLQHWNRSNQGKPAAAAAAVNSREPQATVPGAPDGSERSLGDPAGKSRPGGDPVSRLPRSRQSVDPGRRRLGGHGLAMVLPSAGGAGPSCGLHG